LFLSGFSRSHEIGTMFCYFLCGSSSIFLLWSPDNLVKITINVKTTYNVSRPSALSFQAYLSFSNIVCICDHQIIFNLKPILEDSSLKSILTPFSRLSWWLRQPVSIHVSRIVRFKFCTSTGKKVRCLYYHFLVQI